MGYYGEKPKRFYCPKCGKKKLEKTHRWIGGEYRQIWECKHGAPVRRRRYGYKEPKEPIKPCGCEITHEDRDAKIEDYHDVLGKMARINVPSIQTYLLENDQTIHRKGFEVLYVGDLVSLVRRRDGDGVGVALYWHANTWDADNDDPEMVNPVKRGTSLYNLFHHESALYTRFECVRISQLLRQDGQDIWVKGEDGNPFNGTLGKRRKAKMVEFVTLLEKSLPDIIKECTSERARWQDEQAIFEKELEVSDIEVSQSVHLSHYNGETKQATIRLRSVSAQETVEINKALGMEIRLSFGLGNSRGPIKPEVAIEVCKVFPKQKIEFDINSHFAGVYNRDDRKVTLAQARLLTNILDTAVPV
jgi:hypothetical protein